MSTAGELLEPQTEQTQDEQYNFKPAMDHGNEEHRLVNSETYEQIFVQDNKLMYRPGRIGPARETSWDELAELDSLSEYAKK